MALSFIETKNGFIWHWIDVKLFRDPNVQVSRSIFQAARTWSVLWPYGFTQIYETTNVSKLAAMSACQTLTFDRECLDLIHWPNQGWGQAVDKVMRESFK